MKKLTLILSCIVLAATSASSVSFINQSGDRAAVHIKLNTKPASTRIDFYNDGEKNYKPPIFEKIHWTIVGPTKTPIDCPRVDEVGIGSEEAFILKKTKSGYECVLQPPLS